MRTEIKNRFHRALYILILLLSAPVFAKVGTCRAMPDIVRSTAASYVDDRSTSICGYQKTATTAAAGLVLATPSGKYCGACVEATGSVGTAVFRVIDHCSEADCGRIATLNLTGPAMLRVTGTTSGVRPIMWKFVECPGSEPNVLQYRVTRETFPWFFMFQILNPRYMIATVHVRTRTGIVRATPNLANSFYVSGEIVEPVQIRITDINGSDITDTFSSARLVGSIQNGTQQLPRCNPAP
jgi:expansin (peptidoglycan-binding protein)